MIQNLSIKLKLNLTKEQKDSLRQVCLTYRNALNYTSQIAFDNGKISNGTKLQKLVYYNIRENFKLPAQMACNVPRQVSASYKGLWTKFKQNKKAREQGITQKTYKSLDASPDFSDSESG